MTVLMIIVVFVLIVESIVLIEMCKWVNRLNNDIESIEEQMRIKDWLYDVENGK
jgi:hypothetical protein